MEKKLHLLLKKLLPALFSFFFCCISVSLSGQCDGWTSSIATFTNNTLDMAVDEAGGVYSIGIVGQNSSIGTTEIDLDGYATALFVVKQDTDGEIVWVKSIAGEFFSIRPSITTDEDRVYFSASFTGNIDYEGETFESAIGLNSTIVVSLDLEGNMQWVKELEANGAATHHCGGMTTDLEGNLLVTGRMGTDLLVDEELNLSLEGNGTGGIYLAKFTTDGELEWAKNSVGSAFARGWAIDVDTENNIVIGGYANGPLQFDDNVFANEANGFSGIIAMFDEDGDNLWVTGLPSNDFSPVYGLNTDEDNNIYIVGTIPDSTLVAGNWIDANGQSDAYVAKILPFGVLDWAETFGAFQANGGEWSTGVHFTNEDNLLIVGQVTNGAIFEDDTLDVGPFGNVRTFFAEYSKEGTYLGATATGGNSSQISYQSVLQGDYLYINGIYNGQAMFGKDTLIADPNNPDSLFTATFVWKLNYSEGIQSIESNFDTTLISGSTYELTNTGSSDYENISWSINNGSQFSGVDPLIYSFEDTAAFVCLTLSNCMSRQTICQEFIGLSLSDIPLLTIEEATATDTDGLSETIGTFCELRGTVHGSNFNNDGLSFTLIDETGGIEIYLIDDDLGYTPIEGDRLNIIGTLEQQSGRSQMLPQNIIFVSANNGLNAPTPVSALGEETESEYIELSCLELVEANQWTNEGVFFVVEASNGSETFSIIIHENTDLYGSTAPTSIFDLTGIGIQDTDDNNLLDGYFIRPNSLVDVRLIDELNAAFSAEDSGINDFEFTVTNPSETSTYIWLANGDSIGTGSVIQYDEWSGVVDIGIEVCLTANNACLGEIEECQQIVIGGIESIQGSEFITVSPNPMTKTGTIKLKNSQIIEEFKVFTPQGKNIPIPTMLQGDNVSFDTNTLPDGLYYFHVKDKENGSYVGKFMVVK